MLRWPLRPVRAARAFTPTVIIKTRISGIDVPIDDLVVHWRAAWPLVEANVVSAIEALIVVLNIPIVHVAVDSLVAIDVIDVHIAADDVSVDDDVVVTIVYVDIRDVDARTRAVDPSSAPPTVIVNAVVVPIAITIKPGTNNETDAKGDSQSPCGPAVIADVGIINRHVNVRGFVRNDADVVVLDEDLLLRCGD